MKLLSGEAEQLGDNISVSLASIRAAKQIRSLDPNGFIHIACDEPLEK